MGLGGISHWIIILVIVIVLFGAGRVGNIMGELGKGIKSFKEGMSDEEDEKRARYEETRRQLPNDPARPSDPIDVTARPAERAAPPPRADDDAL